MNGEILAESTENVGTEMKIILHKIKRIKPESLLETNKKHINKQTVIIAEDIDFNRFYIKDILTTLNVNILTAENGKQVLEMCETQKPDLFLLDIQMPELTGTEVAKALRQIEQFKETPIIGMVSLIDFDDFSKNEQYFTDYLRKPISKEALIDLLKKYFE